MNLPFKYEDPISKQLGMNAREALRGPALDFRWQLKHLEYNRSLFCKEVFKQKIGEPEFKRRIINLIEKVDKLKDDLSVVRTDQPEEDSREKSEANAETADTISHLLDEMIQFTEKIYHCIKDKHILVSHDLVSPCN